MQPLIELINANLNFHRLENMIKAKMDVPKFRFKALEDQFVFYMTGICNVCKDFGTLKDHYDIKQMMNTLKIENWESIVPFAFYLHPLQKAITTMRGTLL